MLDNYHFAVLTCTAPFCSIWEFLVWMYYPAGFQWVSLCTLHVSIALKSYTFFTENVQNELLFWFLIRGLHFFLCTLEPRPLSSMLPIPTCIRSRPGYPLHYIEPNFSKWLHTPPQKATQWLSLKHSFSLLTLHRHRACWLVLMVSLYPMKIWSE